MSSAELHRQRKPHARPSTLQRLDKHDQRMQDLKDYAAFLRWKKRLSWLLWIWRRAHADPR